MTKNMEEHEVLLLFERNDKSNSSLNDQWIPMDAADAGTEDSEWKLNNRHQRKILRSVELFPKVPDNHSGGVGDKSNSICICSFYGRTSPEHQ